MSGLMNNAQELPPKTHNTKNLSMTLHERIKGALYGFALGDALGLGTEFMTREEIEAYYPDKCRDFDCFVNDAHRSQCQRGHWTNDTGLLIALIEQILETGHFDACEAAKAIKTTIRQNADDTSALFRTIISTPGWEENPILISRETRNRLGVSEASNEAIHRGIVSGLLSKRNDLDRNTRRMVLLTNDDSRCISSTMVIAYMTYCLLHTGEPASFDELTAICYAVDARTISFLEATRDKDISSIDLDDADTMQYTRKTMAAGLWPVWHCDNPHDYIYKIVDEGGDSDTNAALAGAFAGLRFGYDALPELKEKLLNRDILNGLTYRLTEYIEKFIEE